MCIRDRLITERKGYEKQLNSGAEYVKSPISGVVSYKVDGLEEDVYKRQVAYKK